MKSKLLIIVLLGMIINLSAHFLEEGFEGETIPEGWSIVDNDGDTHNWEIYDVSAAGHTGAQSIMSESWGPGGVGPLTPDNWLISPAISIPDSTYAYWWIATQDPDYPYENYGVFVSTTGTEPGDFTMAFYEELDAGDFTWQVRSLDLQEWAGETIYLAWRHYNCGDNYKIKLDDITVSDQPVASEKAEIMMVNASINQIFPNPFNPETTIKFYTEQPGNVNLSVYNVKGQLVEKLVNSNLDRGDHSVVWQANGQASGMYFFRLAGPGGVSSGKALLLK